MNRYFLRDFIKLTLKPWKGEMWNCYEVEFHNTIGLSNFT